MSDMVQRVFTVNSISSESSFLQKLEKRQRRRKQILRCRKDSYAVEEEEETNIEQCAVEEKEETNIKQNRENSDIIASTNLNLSESVDISDIILNISNRLEGKDGIGTLSIIAETKETNREQNRETSENSDIIASTNLNHSESVNIYDIIPNISNRLEGKNGIGTVSITAETNEGSSQILQCLKCSYRGSPNAFLNPLYCSFRCLNKGSVRFLKKKNTRLPNRNTLPLEENAIETSSGADTKSKNQPTKSDNNISHKNSQDLFVYPRVCPFVWNTYLNCCKAIGAPDNLFKDAFPYTCNGFRPGMKLEGLDPHNPSYFCVLSVVEVTGYRIRLHFDGYPDNYDFWVNADSMEIFPRGWSKKNHHVLHPPPGYTIENFSWADYLKQTKSKAAPKHLFANTAENGTPNKFRIGMKLEAVDRKNPTVVCVATVRDKMYDRILVHLEGQDITHDYWADSTSPYIHPVGWSDQHGLSLTPPKDYPNPEIFTWNKYLKDTNSVPAPERAFKQRPPRDFQRKMRLECVDKRAPHIIRVATVNHVQEHQILIRFDGWPDYLGYWVDEDSPDIHPVGWCSKTGHPLEPPLTPDDVYKSLGCPTVGCRGLGHINGPNNATHSNRKFCPYAEENIHLGNVLPDRLQSLDLQRHVSSELEESQKVCKSVLASVDKRNLKRKYTKHTKADSEEPARKKKHVKRKYKKCAKAGPGEEIIKKSAIERLEDYKHHLLKREVG